MNHIPPGSPTPKTSCRPLTLTRYASSTSSKRGLRWRPHFSSMTGYVYSSSSGCFWSHDCSTGSTVLCTAHCSPSQHTELTLAKPTLEMCSRRLTRGDFLWWDRCKWALDFTSHWIVCLAVSSEPALWGHNYKSQAVVGMACLDLPHLLLVSPLQPDVHLCRSIKIPLGTAHQHRLPQHTTSQLPSVLHKYQYWQC